MSTTRILYGKPVATSILAALEAAAASVTARPALAIIRTTDRPDSDAYIRKKQQAMHSLNFKCTVHSAQTSEEVVDLLELCRYGGALRAPTTTQMCTAY